MRIFPRPRRLLELLASRHLTIGVMLLFALGSLAVARQWLSSMQALGVPMLLFWLNLLAASVQVTRIRSQLELLIFHWSILALTMLMAVAGMTHLEGWVRLTSGTLFEGKLDGVEQGPWHDGQLDQVRFVQDDFSMELGNNGALRRIDNQVLLPDREGRLARVVLTGDRPLELQGYRFIATNQWGFAPLLLWIPLQSREILQGTVQLPSYSDDPFNQARNWTLPQTRRNLWLMLEAGEIPLDPEHPALSTQPDGEQLSLVIRESGQRHTLHQGESIHFPEGTLTYESLSTWMGYRVIYDRLHPWLLAATLTATGSLMLFYWKKFRQPSAARIGP